MKRCSGPLEGLKVIFGNRRTSTLNRRGSSIVQFLKWCKTKFFQLCPFPLTPEAVEEYMAHLHQTKRPASAFHGFIEALNFCQHVLGMQVKLKDEVLITKKFLKILDVEDANRKEKVQARLLHVGEVEFLEQCLLDEKMSLPDKVACGYAFLLVQSQPMV